MRSRSVRLAIPLAPAALLALGILLLAGLELRQTYGEAARRGEEDARNLAHVLAEQTDRTFQAVDFTLLGIRDALKAAPGMTDNDVHFQNSLRERLAALPYVRALYVIGPDGFITHDTDYPSTPRVSLADRPYFKAHQEDPGLGLHVEQPLRSRSVGVWFVGLSRRINRPDGSFGGIVVAAVEPRYFEQFYRGLSVGEGGFIALLLRNGTLLARSPAAEEAIGKSFAAVEPLNTSLTRSPQGVFWGTSPIDGWTRVIGYRALETVPAVVNVGLAQRTVFRPWREHAIVVSISAVVLLGLIGALMVLIQKSLRREQAEQLRFSRAQRLEGLGRIAGGIAHDLGNTIRIMQSTFRLLRPSLADRPDALSLIVDADQALTGARSMIDRLLAFARRQELRPQITVLDERIEGFAPILRQATGPRIALDLRLSANGRAVLLDPVQLEATLLNLVLNARDAMPDGGTIIVETNDVGQSSSPSGNFDSSAVERWVQVTVTDTGIGMAPAVLERAFDPFFTTKGQGNGLGLSQVLGFVQQSSGDVELNSQEGRGTTVRLLFPVVSLEEQLDGDAVAEAAGSGEVRPRPEASLREIPSHPSVPDRIGARRQRR
ncbi:signal transduction histidine kinase [Microvirga lupini]|uniref:histidine kinase n=1 Tax=Microvirga lupini TaxID=420324 RepID=A0A7W4YZE4_9HYPH|nr:hybrid sensor histidine kinase/response regulator [Microvirga lupini]MBB3020948.1 signal transduction histidine kinase [Microvirga lupini]